MLIDTHCHLDASEFEADRAQVALQALENGVKGIVVPAVHRQNFDAVIRLSRHHAHCVYALGIHPIVVHEAAESDLDVLRQYLQEHRPVAVGEIGLDFFIDHVDKARQEHFFVEQLKLAREFGLPVILHVRKAVDDVLKHVRRIRVTGIAHAFNGSRQQAEEFIRLGFKLGFGGAMTYPRALRIRELAKTLPLESIVLETDAPDIAPEWLGHHGRNTPGELPRISHVLAELRGESAAKIAELTSANARLALPGLVQLFT